MLGYVRSPEQWAYVRVTGALAAAALHLPYLRGSAASVIYLQQHLLFKEQLRRRRTAPIPAGPPSTLTLIQSNRRRAAVAPEGKTS